MKTTDKAKTAPRTSVETTKSSIYDIAINALDDTPISLAAYKDKHLFFVNVASKCGFTNQYKALQQLSDAYKDNLMVIGVPCNQFGKQEPGDASQIQTFCERNFGVTFLLTEKIDVKGSQQHPLYTWLTSKDLNGKKNSNVIWNFQKYLVDDSGRLIDYYLPITKPMSSSITNYL